MAILLSGVSMPLSADDNEIRVATAKRLGVDAEDIDTLRIKRQSLDSRKKDIRFVYTIHITLRDAAKQKRLEARYGAARAFTPEEIVYGTQNAQRVVVVGAGPCGLFAAYELAMHGYKPLLIERGQDMPQREADVVRLTKQGILCEESNICFGAGGAGAFSDGKLTTRIKDGRSEIVLKTLYECGAPEEILTLAKPHMGTENIRAAVTALTERIETLGGEVSFGAKLTDICVRDGKVRGITYIQSGKTDKIDTNALILAIGHSARDTYMMLRGCGVQMVQKPFAVGLRIEHKREMIDRVQYGKAFGHPRLGAAEYRLTAKHEGRGVYTFCMCPGGEVVCSATEAGGVAVNGMSYYARDAENSNSAVVISVNPNDFGDDPLDGIAFQRHMERASYAITGGYGAPVQTLGDFVSGKATTQFGDVVPSYRPYTTMSNLHTCLPDFVSAGISTGLIAFGCKLAGFDTPDAVLIAPETRTSSPVRLPRGDDFQSVSVKGLYPAGEGAGYAGGIVSAAVDGIRCAEALMETFARP